MREKWRLEFECQRYLISAKLISISDLSDTQHGTWLLPKPDSVSIRKRIECALFDWLPERQAIHDNRWEGWQPEINKLIECLMDFLASIGTATNSFMNDGVSKGNSTISTGGNTINRPNREFKGFDPFCFYVVYRCRIIHGVPNVESDNSRLSKNSVTIFLRLKIFHRALWTSILLILVKR